MSKYFLLEKSKIDKNVWYLEISIQDGSGNVCRILFYLEIRLSPVWVKISLAKD